MTIIGRISGSQNKNFTKHTIKKKAHNNILKDIDNALDSLRKNGLIRYYRKPDNFATTKLGFLVARRLKEKFQEKIYPDLRILLAF